MMNSPLMRAGCQGRSDPPPVGHGVEAPGQARTKGFERFSTPIVVSGPWPG